MISEENSISFWKIIDPAPYFAPIAARVVSAAQWTAPPPTLDN